MHSAPRQTQSPQARNLRSYLLSACIDSTPALCRTIGLPTHFALRVCSSIQDPEGGSTPKTWLCAMRAYQCAPTCTRHLFKRLISFFSKNVHTVENLVCYYTRHYPVTHTYTTSATYVYTSPPQEYMTASPTYIPHLTNHFTCIAIASLAC